MLLLSFFVGALLAVANASTFSPARPPAIPLAVKSPYLNTWLQAGNDGAILPGQWPQFWEGRITAWTGMIRVDGKAYTWMGNPNPRPPLATQTAFEYTSTRSIFTFNVADKVEMKVEFLSPVYPDDPQRQSLVFSYLEVRVTSLDDAHHQVQLYTDVSAEWASGNQGAVVQWNRGDTGNVTYHSFSRQEELAFTENRDQAEWGTWFYATDNTPGVTYQTGSDAGVRSTFALMGVLSNTEDYQYRPINDDWPVFAFSKDFGNCARSEVSTLFSIGLAQDFVVQFEGAGPYEPLPALWQAYFPDGIAALDFFHHDYSTAVTMSDALDQKVAKESRKAAGQDYLTITSLTVRQTFGATQLAGSADKYYLFLKEISSNGNMQTVDVIFPAYPLFLYFNPSLLKLLLDPHFENQEAGKYPKAFSIHDLGAHYPNATGHPDGVAQEMPLEECGNMIIMALSYAQRSKDTDYLKQHYKILKQWAEFLVDEALIPENQLSTDDFAGLLANQTNLALKGIIGIEAMSQIADLTGAHDEAQNYTSIAHEYISKWQTYGIAHDANPPHTTLNYGKNESFNLLYNLYADRVLGLNLVPQSVYDMQSLFYPTVLNEFGVPLDTRHLWTKADWEIFVASIASVETRDLILSTLARWVNVTTTDRALTDLYESDTGGYPGFQFVARPVMGGSFALLALPEAMKTKHSS
ncbi:glutaminase GtaA [Eremomyces bilateralis CBS 781.70]|uniref:Glutaminase GtaA n=1 Tax=Eremomyces bilateralis CBS 781.70 TaxID=1392243 RepID=A0A6G1G334_9PEZI|nr:glutaminase GtaA [Eremomyces bilateralis CBS 781.70]KAF1812219.1 glutaminase GtaA [Eremomyces bilateralis CBS 781.70]